VRTFEQFRRDLAVDIASDYFQLQQLRQRSSTQRRASVFYSGGRTNPGSWQTDASWSSRPSERSKTAAGHQPAS
jgi:hypothetical protein